jgi:hypothetical protein
MSARRIKINYRKVDLDELADWLDESNIKHSLVPDTGMDGEVGRLIFFLEVYDAKDETAIRLKWETI